ncbi:hypothetical protein [Rhodopirellula halodulae]|nr:hypothetical protein [Rhodopirellula sp. JC737]MCC9654574.1 hypothetical protein [Rhodopirellula sp. JC737]
MVSDHWTFDRGYTRLTLRECIAANRSLLVSEVELAIAYRVSCFGSYE